MSWMGPGPGNGQKAVLVRLSALGDVVRILPLIGPLRRRWGLEHLSWVVGPGAAALVRAHPEVDKTWELPRLGFRSLGTWWRTLRNLRKEVRPDLCLDLQGLAKSGLVVLGTGARLRLGLGPGRAREGSQWLLHGGLGPGQRSRYGELLELLGLSWEEWQSGAEALRQAWEVPREKTGILLHPGGSRPNRYKRWPARHFIQLGRALSQRFQEPILVQYGPGEEELARSIADGIGSMAQAVTSPDLLSLFRQLAGQKLFIGGDTGPLHLALLAGTPALAIYGPSDPEVYALPSNQPHRVVRNGVSCSPCRYRQCPTRECLEHLESSRVELAAAELLGSIS